MDQNSKQKELIKTNQLKNENYSSVKEIVVKYTGDEDEKNVYKKESLIKNFKDFSIVYEASAGVINSLPNAAMSGGMNGRDPYVTRNIQQTNFLSKLSNEIFGKHENKRRKKK